ncbi:cytochrome-c peroxidase [bacterium]|nr:cytochrome-c peroxidase [bacterium]
MNKFLGISVILLLTGFTSCKEDPGTGKVNGTLTPYEQTPYDYFENPNLPPPNFPKDNMPTVEGVELGRMLFYDPILSGDSSLSCSGCHNQAFAFTDNGRQFSTGINGDQGRRNSMPIFNLMWHLDGFFWDGRSELLRHQAIEPIKDPIEMDETIAYLLVKLNRDAMYKEAFAKAFNITEIDEEHVALALEQFMMTITSGYSKFDLGRTVGFSNFTPAEMRGLEIFNAESYPNDPNNKGGDCFHCHSAPLFMTRALMNTGLDSFSTDPGLEGVTGDPKDRGKFKVPSLRNIEMTAPYMHDGRFATLDEVIEFYANGVHFNANLDPNMHALQDSVYLSPQQRSDLIAFLKTLTDEDFLNNEEYSNPFN